jgi:glyoxylase-like metal-dependent hydrolase (beta-lactamase superfamily II)
VAYAVETSDGLVLVDSGLEASGAWLAREVRVRGLDISRLRLILLTHAHGDHSLGAEAFRRATGAKVYAGRGDCQALRTGAPREAFFSTHFMPDYKAHPTTVDVELSGGEVIPVGDVRFRVIAAPGHTPGSVCYLLEKDGHTALFSGDVVNSVASGSEPRFGLGTYAAYLAPRYRGDAGAYLATLQTLLASPAPDFILPGHPERGDQDFRVTPAEWQSVLGDGIGAMRVLLARYREGGANFLDGVPKELLRDLYYLGDFGGAAIYCLVTPAGAFLFDAPGGPDLVGFVGARLPQLGVKSAAVAAVVLTSCDPDALAGLQALVQKTGCKVVAPAAGRQAVPDFCRRGATVLTEGELERAGWFPVRAVPLGGRGVAPVAYVLRWRNKTVLISGRIPIKLTPPTAEQLIRSLVEPGGSTEHYLQALGRLGDLRPDLWLPLVPEGGQNANLYGGDWAETLSANEQLVRPVTGLR